MSQRPHRTSIRPKMMFPVALAIAASLPSAASAGSKVHVGANVPAGQRVTFDAIDHREWDRLLSEYVDDQGMVAYARWKRSDADTRALDDYLRHLSAANPQTRVLSAETGHRRDYRLDPYDGYLTSPRVMFPVTSTSDRLTTKQLVLGVWVGDTSKAYPLSVFGEQPVEFRDNVAGRSVTLAYEPNPKRLRVVSADDGVRWMYSLWYAWHAFRPETEVVEPSPDADIRR